MPGSDRSAASMSGFGRTAAAWPPAHGMGGLRGTLAGVDSIDFNRVCKDLRSQYWETMPVLFGADHGIASVSDPTVENGRECLAALSPL